MGWISSKDALYERSSIIVTSPLGVQLSKNQGDLIFCVM